MAKKVILDLCGGTGAWSKPYKEAGYDVKLITLPDYDVTRAIFHNGMLMFPSNVRGKKNLVVRMEKVYGILAAPPCTMFSIARTRAKKPRDFEEGMRTVRACMEIIWMVQERSQDTNKKITSLKFWALENPYGMLRYFLGEPFFIFNPWEFGDGYQKKTALWGSFKRPVKKPVEMTDEVKNNLKGNRVMMLKKFDYLKSKEIHPEAFGKLTRQERRAITPAGFARAFFEANK